MRWAPASFDYFLNLIRNAPALLRALLRESNVASTENATGRLTRVFSSVTDQDYVYGERDIRPDHARLSELAVAQGIDGDLPARVYQLYCERLERGAASGTGYIPSDEEIQFFLTNGTTPLDEFFLVRGHGVCRWGGKSSGTIETCAILAAEYKVPCENYLLRQGRVFPSYSKVLWAAEKCQWPGWQRVKAFYNEKSLTE